MASTKFYLDCRGKAADGKGSIIIQIFHNHSMTSVSTGVRVSPSDWNGQEVVHISGTEVINAKLQEQKSNINKSIALLSFDPDFNSITAAQLKAKLSSRRTVPDKHLVSQIFQEYMDMGLKSGTKKIYDSTLKKIIAFTGRDITIEEIDYKWLKQFDRFLSKTQGANGKAIYLRSLRAVCNYAIHSKIITSYAFDNFKIKYEPTKKRCISIEKFREFLSFPVTKEQSICRDYFLLMFYLIGINAKDLLLAKKSQIVKGRLEYIREKTNKRYSIKIEPEAQELIDKYSGKSEYLLEAMDHYQHYENFLHYINDNLKEIGTIKWEMIPDPNDLFGQPKLEKHITPVIPGISSYFARHSWATFAYDLGISLDVISQALGHSFGNRTTLIYVKSDRSKVDAANRKVIDFLLGS